MFFSKKNRMVRSEVREAREKAVRKLEQRKAWLRAQAISLGTSPNPVSEQRKAWLRRQALSIRG